VQRRHARLEAELQASHAEAAAAREQLAAAAEAAAPAAAETPADEEGANFAAKAAMEEEVAAVAAAAEAAAARTAWSLLKAPGMRRLLTVNWLLSMSWDVHSFAVPLLGHERGLQVADQASGFGWLGIL
jgi:hypothetical protein